jgi:tellurite resistance protein TerC
VPPQLVDICLNYGITGSIVLRGIFIFAGLAAASVFAPVLLGFSVFLIGSSYSMLAGGDDDEEEEDAPPELVTDLLAKVPMTGTFEGEKFFVNTPEGLRATQLTGTLVCIALCDVLLAVDSTNPNPNPDPDPDPDPDPNPH